MKKSIVKPLAVCLCATLLASSGIAAYAMTNGKKEETTEKQSKAAVHTANEQENAKDETVYVIAGADGSVQKIIVSDWIKNNLNNSTLNDKSELTDVENVKGDESYTLGSDNTRVWDAKGDDIYYQGNIEKELPVGMSVTYKLDGKTISPAELAGKSGKVTIRFDYSNMQYENVEINGQKEKIYVPFAMLTGVLMDNDVFTKVEVSNGKLINDGDRTAVIGIAFPGLQENLAVSKEKFEIPDYVEITADVKDFELGMTITLATNELFNELDVEQLDSIDDLSKSLGELNNAMGQLMDGSSKLYNGLSTLLSKSSELVDGINKLAAGAQALKAGAGNLDAGASKLQVGAAQLSEGLNALSSNNDTLNGGARQVFETLLSTANAQLAGAGLNVPALTISNYADVLNGVIAASGGAQSVVSLKASLDSYHAFYLGLQSYTAGVSQAAAGAKELKTGTADLKAGTGQLYAGASELYEGILTLKNGAPALVDGVTQLRDGAMQLSNGLKEFNEKGIQKLVDAVDGDLAGLTTRIRATVDVSKNYRSFSGINEDMEGQVKFVYRTEAIEQ